jgi:NADH-quinone oxidoreductase subunit E
VLQKVQEELGYISEESIHRISAFLNLPTGKVFGLATFYNQFRFSPPGKYHIRVCNGTGCHMEGSGRLIKEISKLLAIGDNETTRDGLFSLEILSCIGACGMAPVISINDQYFEKVDVDKLKQILKECKENSQLK